MDDERIPDPDQPDDGRVLDADWVRDYALGTLSGWGDGYTDPLDDGFQRRVAIEEDNATDLVLRFEHTYFSDGVVPDRRFRVTVQVEELT